MRVPPKPVAMTPYRLHRSSWIAACAIVGVFSSATAAHGQTNFDAQQTEALSAAARASPDFDKGLAKELGSMPEQAAGGAGVLFTILQHGGPRVPHRGGVEGTEVSRQLKP